MITVTINETDSKSIRIIRDGTDITGSVSGFAAFKLLNTLLDALLSINRSEINEPTA